MQTFYRKSCQEVKHSPLGSLARLSFLFSCAILIFIAAWTLLPALIRHELPPDLIEAYIWGHPFFLGNDKNPWLPAAFVKAGIWLGGSSGVGIYLLQSLVVSLGFWCIYRLTTRIANPIYGLIATFSLFACAAYTVEIQIFNDNYLLMGLIPVATLCF